MPIRLFRSRKPSLKQRLAATEIAFYHLARQFPGQAQAAHLTIGGELGAMDGETFQTHTLACDMLQAASGFNDRLREVADRIRREDAAGAKI